MKILDATDVAIDKPEVKIDPAITASLKKETLLESQVIIHLSYTSESYNDRVRIWRSTFLKPAESSESRNLLHIENISVYPVWTSVMYKKTLHFTLIFEGLPKDCSKFTLYEDIPEPGGWIIENIVRNKADVYYINLNDC